MKKWAENPAGSLLKKEKGGYRENERVRVQCSCGIKS